MHISDGLLPQELWISGYVITAGATALSLRRLSDRQIPSLAVMTSGFFAASLVRYPVGGTSIHLILHGLVGVVVGWRAFLPIVVGLTLQALLFGHGGITTIGINAVLLGVPAVLVGVLLRFVPLERSRLLAMAAGFVAGAGAMVLSLSLFVAVGHLAGEGLLIGIKVMVTAHLILAVIEGAVTAAAVGYLSHVAPELLQRRVPAGRRLGDGRMVESPAGRRASA